MAMRWAVRSLATPYGPVLTAHWACLTHQDSDDSDTDDDGDKPLRLPTIAEQRALESAEDELGAVLWNGNEPVLEHFHTIAADSGDDPDDCLVGHGAVELGAGVGCLGIALAAGGATVSVTDLTALVPLMQKNVRLSDSMLSRRRSFARYPLAHTVAAEELQWGAHPIGPGALRALQSAHVTKRWAVLCDALYGNRRDWPALVALLHQLCDRSEEAAGRVPEGTDGFGGVPLTILNYCEQRVAGVENAFLALLDSDAGDRTPGALKPPPGPAPNEPNRAGASAPTLVQSDAAKQTSVWRWRMAVLDRRSGLDLPIRCVMVTRVPGAAPPKAQAAAAAAAATTAVSSTKTRKKRQAKRDREEES